jgi:hypothetical protein
MALDRPRPDTDYRPTPAWVPRDLLSAVWFRFILEMADARPWRVCMGCGLPFLVTRDDQTTCPGSQACLKRRQRRVHFGR